MFIFSDLGEEKVQLENVISDSKMTYLDYLQKFSFRKNGVTNQKTIKVLEYETIKYKGRKTNINIFK